MFEPSLEANHFGFCSILSLGLTLSQLCSKAIYLSAFDDYTGDSTLKGQRDIQPGVAAASSDLSYESYVPS
jgi:hypothetical protein